MSNLQFSNKSFARMIRIIRRILPALAAVLLIGVYAVSAIAGGMFLARLMASLPGGIVLAYSIGVAIQATRATLVFFNQLNPTRPSFGYTGEVVAVVMGVISIVEILSLVSAAGLAQPVAISLSILMAAGVGVELYLLREIKFSTEIELYGAREHWGELQSFYRARKEFRLFMDRLADMEEGGLEAGSTRAAGNGSADQETAKQIAEAEALVEGVNLHRVEVRPKAEFSGNGNGQH